MNNCDDIIFDLALDVLKDQPELQSWTFTNSELIKFGRAVAKECATVVSSVQPCFDDYRDQIEENMRDFCAKKVLTHFGVLE